MVEIEKPRITCLDQPQDTSYGKFVVEPLERGYGMTLGNSLRRILLSSLPGYAATSVKIQGIQHEFSTIPGVTEDVTEIVLNVKRITPKLLCAGTKPVHIDAVGQHHCDACADILRCERVDVASIYLYAALEWRLKGAECTQQSALARPVGPQQTGELPSLEGGIQTTGHHLLAVARGEMV